MGTTDSSTAQRDAQASVRKSGNQVVMTLAGNWNIRHAPNQQIDKVLSDLDRQGPADTLAFQTQDLGSWDTSLVLLVSRVEEWCRQHRVSLAQDSLPPGIRDLLALANEVPEKKSGRGGAVERRNLLVILGTWALNAAAGVRVTLTFTGEIVLSIGRLLTRRAAFNWRLFWLTMQQCSAQALP